MANFNPIGWRNIYEGQIQGANSALVVRRATLPLIFLFATFRVQLVSFVAGQVDTSLRFGMLNADADACTLGIDFPTMNAADQSFYRSQVWDTVAAVPGTVGNPLSILPPRVSMQVDTPGGTDLVLRIQVAGIEVA